MHSQQQIFVHPSSLLPPANDPKKESRSLEDVTALAIDLQVRGMRHPIYAMRRGDKLEVLTGETRRQAALHGGLEKVPVVVMERPLTEAEILLEQLLENEMRSDFSPLDRARIYQRLMKLNNWSQAELAGATHKSKSQISKALAVSSRLPDDLRRKIADGELCPTVGYALSKLFNPEQMRDLAEKWSKGILKRDSVEEQVTRILGGRPKKDKAIRLPFDGVIIIIVKHDPAKLGAALSEANELRKKAEKHGLPLSALPNLLKAS